MLNPVNLSAVRNPSSQWERLVKDVTGSLVLWRFWMHLGWGDVLKQYRRSFLGPVWISLNTAIFIVVFALIGAQLFKMSLETYLPYFCVGHVVFSFFSALAQEGCQTYIGAESFLKQTPYPKTAFVWRVMWRNLIMLAHNLPVVLGVLWWGGAVGEVRPGWLLAGLLLTVLAGAFLVAILGAISARFRDVPMMVSSLMQISFFVTPVMWQPDQLTERARLVVTWNPLAAFLDLIRRPLLGEVPETASLYMACCVTVGLGVVFVLIYLGARRRIVYWL